MAVQGDLKELRRKVREAQRSLNLVRQREAETRAQVEQHEAYLRKILSPAHEARDLIDELQALACDLTRTMIVVHGLEHEHRGAVVSVANVVATMCGQMQAALSTIGTTKL